MLALISKTKLCSFIWTLIRLDSSIFSPRKSNFNIALWSLQVYRGNAKTVPEGTFEIQFSRRKNRAIETYESSYQKSNFALWYKLSYASIARFFLLEKWISKLPSNAVFDECYILGGKRSFGNRRWDMLQLRKIGLITFGEGPGGPNTVVSGRERHICRFGSNLKGPIPRVADSI